MEVINQIVTELGRLVTEEDILECSATSTQKRKFSHDLKTCPVEHPPRGLSVKLLKPRDVP